MDKKLGKCNSVILQLNFNGSNTFGTMKISSRKGSGGIIGIYFRFSFT